RTARPGKVSLAKVQASGTPKIRPMTVAESDATRERRSASTTCGIRSSSQAADQGARTSRPSSGRMKKAAPTTARITKTRGAAGWTLPSLRAGEAIPRQRPLAVAEQVGDEGFGQVWVLRIHEDGDGVVGVHVHVRWNPDTLHTVARGLDVGDVDDAGICLAERHLADDRLDVRLLAGGFRGDARLLQGLGGVTPAGNGRGAENDDEPRPGQIRKSGDMLRIPGGDHELEAVVCKRRRRSADEPALDQLLHVRLVRGREDIADRPLLDL